MTVLGVVLLALGVRAAVDADNEVYQTVSGIIVAAIGVALVVMERTGWRPLP